MDYKQKYLKYKKKYLDLKGSSRGYENNNVVDMNIVIQNVLNLNQQELDRRRQVLRNNPFVFGNMDPLQRPARPINFFPPNPEAGRALQRQWAHIVAAEEEQADDARKRYLLEHHYKVNWDTYPQSWWPFNN